MFAAAMRRPVKGSTDLELSIIRTFRLGTQRQHSDS